jgi:SprT protein
MKYITVSPTLEKSVREKIESTLEICRKKYGKPLPAPTLKFRQAGRMGGYYQPPSPFWGKAEVLVINPDFFKNHYDEQLNVTVPHEVAHYVTHHVFGNVQAHGWQWASVMRVIGLPPDRCHTFSLEGVKTRQVDKPYHYACGCIVHLLTKQKHTKCQSNLTNYGKTGLTCRKCRKPLIYQGFTKEGAFIPYRKVEVKHVAMTTGPVFVNNAPPVTLKEPESSFRYTTKFIGGSLVNVKVPMYA